MKLMILVFCTLLTVSVGVFGSVPGRVSIEPWVFSREERANLRMWADHSGAFRFSIPSSNPSQDTISYKVWIDHYHPDQGLTPYEIIPVVPFTQVGHNFQGKEIKGAFSLAITQTGTSEALLTIRFAYCRDGRYSWGMWGKSSYLLAYPTSSSHVNWRIIDSFGLEYREVRVGTPIPIASATFPMPSSDGSQWRSTSGVSFFDREIAPHLSHNNHVYVLYIAIDVNNYRGLSVDAPDSDRLLYSFPITQ